MREIWYQLYVPMLIYVFILIFFVVSRICKIKCCKRKASFSIAFWQSTLLCLGVILSVTLKLVACRTIDSGEDAQFGVVMFYAGGEGCFGITWFVSLLALLFIIVSFTIIYNYLRRLPNSKKLDPNFRFRTLMFSFKPDRWQWEFVLLSRRILISTLATFQYYSKDLFNLILLGVVAIYFGLQCYYRPFIHPECNVMEAIFLFFAMVIITGVGLVDIRDDTHNYLGLFVSLLIIVPMILYVFYFIRIFIVYRKIIKPFQSQAVQYNVAVANQSGNALDKNSNNTYNNSNDTNGKIPPKPKTVNSIIISADEDDDIVDDMVDDIVASDGNFGQNENISNNSHLNYVQPGTATRGNSGAVATDIAMVNMANGMVGAEGSMPGQ